MSKPAFVYISTDPYRNLTIGVTKDLDVAAFAQESLVGHPIKIVHREEFATIKEAVARLRALQKMGKKARGRFISKANPQWRDLALRPVFASSRPSSSENYPGDDRSRPGDEGGVAATVPRPPIRPLVAADAKAWPIEID